MQCDHQSLLASALTTSLTIVIDIHHCLLLRGLGEFKDNLLYIYYSYLRSLVFSLLLLHNFLGRSCNESTSFFSLIATSRARTVTEQNRTKRCLRTSKGKSSQLLHSLHCIVGSILLPFPISSPRDMMRMSTLPFACNIILSSQHSSNVLLAQSYCLPIPS